MNDITDKFCDRLHLELGKETDRSVAIVASALLDEALKESVKARLLPARKNEWCILSGGNSPLSTFSSRINFCYQIGLISHVMQRDLHIIRKLRNDFAHNPFELSFNYNAVKNRVSELDNIANYREKNPEARSNVGPAGTKHDFIFAVGWRLYCLTELIKDIEPNKDHSPEFGYLDLDAMQKIFESQVSGNYET
jgi:DNA-binding MltR family transcriptional regulator